MSQLSGAGQTRDREAAAVFAGALGELAAGRRQAAALRPELSFEDVPPPRTLAPFAGAFAAAAVAGEAELASGRFVLLYDPAGQRGWAGPLRVIVYVRADLDPEIAADPLIGAVGWSWLTEALDRTAGYEAASGTVTRVVTEGFGGKAGEAPVTGFELRASWSPVPAGASGGTGGHGLAGHVTAWCGVLCAAAGLPPLAAGVAPLRAPAARGRP
jgi:hypothetical protein